MSQDLGPPEQRRGGSCKIRRDPSEYGSVPAHLPRRCALRRPSYGRATRAYQPQNRLDLDRMSQDLGPPKHRRGESHKIGRDPGEDGSVPAPLPRRCALRRPSHGRATRSPRTPETARISTGCRKIQAPRAGARRILQNWARSGRRRVGTRPSPTSVRPTQGDARPRNPTPPDPKTARISTRCREIQALPSHGEEDPPKSGEIRDEA
jgi:hypothetical protein